MQVKIKKLSKKAVIPKYAKDGDAGMDLTATSKEFDENGNVVYGTGLSFEIPKGYVGLLFPRSSNSKKSLLLSNSVGVIDSGYRGEVMMKFKGTNQNLLLEMETFAKQNKCGDTLNDLKLSINERFKNIYEVGDRIGQLIIMPHPYIDFLEVDELNDSERGSGSYGSTGK